MQAIEIKKGILPERSGFIRYVFYVIRNGFKKKFEKKLFLPHVLIKNREPVYNFKKCHRPELFQNFFIHGEDRNNRISFEQSLESSGTTAFIVIQEDALLYENYFKDRKSVV